MTNADDPLAALLKPERLIDVVDVGANPHGGYSPPYKTLLAKRLCRVIGFEPQAEALRNLDKAKGPNETYLPYALGDGETHTLHVCVADGMTSLFEPDPSTLELFPEFPEWGRVVKRDRIRTVRLDEVSEIETIDWLKIDIQAGELSALQNGRSKLAHVVAIHTEVSFVPLYRNQPPFGAIDLELRSLGLLPHAFTDINRRTVAPLRSSNPYDHINQMVEADIVYVRDFRDMSALSVDQLTNLALICHHSYSSFDIAARCVAELQRRNRLPADALQRYGAIMRSHRP